VLFPQTVLKCQGQLVFIIQPPLREGWVQGFPLVLFAFEDPMLEQTQQTCSASIDNSMTSPHSLHPTGVYHFLKSTSLRLTQNLFVRE
jgi:hypothetical protein